MTSKKETLQPCAGGTEISELAALRADVNQSLYSRDQSEAPNSEDVHRVISSRNSNHLHQQKKDSVHSGYAKPGLDQVRSQGI